MFTATPAAPATPEARQLNSAEAARRRLIATGATDRSSGPTVSVETAADGGPWSKGQRVWYVKTSTRAGSMEPVPAVIAAPEGGWDGSVTLLFEEGGAYVDVSANLVTHREGPTGRAARCDLCGRNGGKRGRHFVSEIPNTSRVKRLRGVGAAFKSSAKPMWCLPCSQDRTASKSDGPIDRYAQLLLVDGPVTPPVADAITTPATRSAAKHSTRNRKKKKLKKKTRAQRTVKVRPPRKSKRKMAQLRVGEGQDLQTNPVSIGEVETVSSAALVGVLGRVQCIRGCGGTMEAQVRYRVVGSASQYACKCEQCGAEEEIDFSEAAVEGRARARYERETGKLWPFKSLPEGREVTHWLLSRSDTTSGAHSEYDRMAGGQSSVGYDPASTKAFCEFVIPVLQKVVDEDNEERRKICEECGCKHYTADGNWLHRGKCSPYAE